MVQLTSLMCDEAVGGLPMSKGITVEYVRFVIGRKELAVHNMQISPVYAVDYVGILRCKFPF